MEGCLEGSLSCFKLLFNSKKDKDLTHLKSWRPLSILNTDYKILAKVLSNRLKVALGVYCGENVKLISDVIDYCQFYDYPCLILLANFEKAFDTIKWSFLKAALKAFGFGPVFQHWITILYTNIESCVTNNGHLSKYFKLWKGIRQGCPISALLFLLVAEIIAITLRQSENV